MRVLITGANGQVGQELTRLAPRQFNVHCCNRQQLDITDSEAVRLCINNIKPDLIINAAAYTAVDRAESEQDLAYAVNATGTYNLGQAAESLSIPLLHISTDYVFPGDSDQPLTEDMPAAPVNAYGTSKLAGETQLLNCCSRAIILRTSWVFGSLGNNFVKTMLKLAQNRDHLNIVGDQFGGPTAAADIANTLWRLGEIYRNSSKLEWGIYHYSGRPAVSWAQFAEEIFAQAQALHLIPAIPAIEKIPTAEYPTPAKRPLQTVLDCSCIENTYGIYQPPWKPSLRRLLRERQKYSD